MREIADWLEKLGMPEYAQCFAENKIDVSVLLHLTDQDLEDIANCGAKPERQALGTPRRNEHGASLARSGQAG
jgi:SAM domain (Sterile alpha motif)